MPLQNCEINLSVNGLRTKNMLFIMLTEVAEGGED